MGWVNCGTGCGGDLVRKSQFVEAAVSKPVRLLFSALQSFFVNCLRCHLAWRSLLFEMMMGDRRSVSLCFLVY